MAIRRVCDRCGREVKIGLISKNLIKKGIIDKYYDLCPVCLVDFDKWMKGEKYEPKTENEENETGAGVV